MFREFLHITMFGFLVSKFAFYPDKETYIPPQNLPVHIQLLKIPTLDRLTIEGLLLHKKDSQKIIIYFHGNAGNMYHRISEADQLFSMGYSVLIAEYRGYAKSEGKVSERGIYIDGHSIFAFVQEKLGYKTQNIVIYGRSIGTTVAIEVAQEKKIHRLILVTPLSSGEDMMQVSGLSFFRFFIGSPFPSIKKIQKVECPVLFLHGDKDEVIPYEHALKLQDVYFGKKKFITIKNGYHNDLEFQDPKLFWNSIANFLAGEI